MRTLYLKSPQPLSALAESCFALTPKVTLCGPFDLYLEIGCTEKLFGGEAALLHKAEKLFDAFTSRSCRKVLTDRPEWARALLQDTDVLLPPGKSAEFLRLLSLDKLTYMGDPFADEEEKKEKTKLVTFMKKVGLRSCGDFLDLPIAAVHQRFGKLGETLHDWTSGRRQLCLPLFHSDEPLRESLDAEDLHSLEALLFRLRQSLIRIEARLHGRACAAKKIRLTFNLESHPAVTKTLELTEGFQDAQTLLRVLKEFLGAFHWESPLVRLELEIQDFIPHRPGQLSLFDDSENRFQDLAQYVARLRARFGEDRAGFAALQSSYLPERSCKLTWPPPPLSAKRESFPPRPLFLYSQPKPFQPSARWDLALTENLFTEWWEPHGQREYFIARNDAQCLWVYRDHSERSWFIHGSFD